MEPWNWLDTLRMMFVPVLLIVVVAYVYRPSARDRFERAKLIPFADHDRARDSRHDAARQQSQRR